MTSRAEDGRHRWAVLLAGLGLLAVLAAGLLKVLLFRNLEYHGSDFYSFLEMTWSWLYTGVPLRDNVYGHHAAIHNYYGLMALAPLTIVLGAYGLILALVLAHGAAVLRVARCVALDPTARATILLGALGPVTFFVFDHPEWGFHPELLYPPLALLLAIELLGASQRDGGTALGGWTWRAVAIAVAIVLVKEDGAVVCAAVVVAHTVWRASALRESAPEEARRALRTGLVSLLVLLAVFLAGMALLHVLSEHYAAAQTTSTVRLGNALKLLTRTVSGHGRARLARLEDSLTLYLAIAALMLLPLGRRIPRGLLLLAGASTPVLVVILVSSAAYRFNMMLWPPRVATLQAAIIAALVFAAWTPPGRRAARPAAVLVLAALSWVGQVGILHNLGYPFDSRRDALASAFGPPSSPLTPAEDAALRCVASRLPWALPVSPGGLTHLFHRQSIVFGRHEARAWHPPRLRVVRAPDRVPRAETPCRGLEVGGRAVELECALLPLVRGCEPESTAPAREKTGRR